MSENPVVYLSRRKERAAQALESEVDFMGARHTTGPSVDHVLEEMADSVRRAGLVA